MSYFKNKKAYSATCGCKRDYRNNDEKIHNTRNNLLIWGNFGIICFIRQNQVYVYGYVMKKLFYFLKESEFDKILFSLNTDRMVLKYAYPQKHLRYLIP